MNDVLDELIEWISLNHEHHFNCEGDDTCCPDSTWPYVNSIELVKKIRELKGDDTPPKLRRVK